MTKFKTAFAPHDRHFVILDPVSLTHQSMAPECDINSIMRKYERTGVLEHRNTFEGQYGDFTNVTDYHESMNQVIAADEMFQTLPAKIRRRFHNDPGAFLEYASDPDNQDDLIKMGLATRAPDPVLDNPEPPPLKPKKAAPAAPPASSEDE